MRLQHESPCRWDLPRGSVALAGAALTTPTLGKSLAGCSMAVALWELPLRVAFHSSAFHFQALLPKVKLLVHLGAFRKSQRTGEEAGASSLVLSTD